MVIWCAGEILSHGFRAMVPSTLGPDQGDQKKRALLNERRAVSSGFVRYHFTTQITTSLSVTVVAGAFGSHGTSGPLRAYPPEVSGPAPMRMVTPRFVEIVALSMTTEFLKIMIPGATIMIAVTRAAIRIRFLAPVTLSAHMIATMIAMSKKRGCMNVARANQPPT